MIHLKFKKYGLIVVDPKGRKSLYHNAEHVINGRVHIIKCDDEVLYYPCSKYTVRCVNEQKEKPDLKESADRVHESRGFASDDINLDDLLNAGNELHRLVCLTRDGIYDSNTIQGTDKFPEDEEGQEGKEWFEEYRDAAQEWNIVANSSSK